tara:strand:+ start:402 stop:2813 length:2412 start_codon:yes stop_codon:yes gene_type:complete
MTRELVRLIVFIVSLIYGQDLFDPYQVHEMDITFHDSNYDQILQDRWAEDDKTYELATVVFNGDTLDSVGVRYKGNSTYFFTNLVGSTKYPLNIDLDLIYDDQDLLGYNKVKLSNSIFDPTYVKETLGYLTQGYYLPTPETGYTTVKINGEYLGLYITVESINKSFLTKHFGNNEGTFFKCEPQFQFGEFYDASPSLAWFGDDTMEYAYQMGYELKSDYGWSDLIDLIHTLNFNMDSIESILNVDRALWYLATSTVMPDLDAYNGMYIHNYYLYKNSTSERFEIIPWDKDQTFGGAMINTLIEWGGNSSWVYQWDPFEFEYDGERPLVSKLMGNPLYKKIFTAHMRTIIDDIYDVEHVQDLAYEIQDSIELYADSYLNILPVFNYADYFRYNVDNYLVTADGGNWCGVTSTISDRRQYLLNHNEISKEAPDILNVYQENYNPLAYEDVIILAAVIGSDFVELMVSSDGPDSDFISIQMEDDGLHGDEFANDNIYGATIPYHGEGDEISYYIRASNEEALAVDPRKAQKDFYHYVVGDQTLPDSTIMINEINYNSSDEIDPGDWVELYNPSASVIDISGYQFKDEDDDHIFLIPNETMIEGHSFLVLCNDTSSFKTIFPEVNSYVGNLDFGFSGGGELLRLYNANNSLVDTVSYDDSDPWPVEPDGNGPTLELINPNLDNAVADSWAASNDFGTPGEVNSVFLSINSRENIPSQFILNRNYPNPFNPNTTIEYQLDRDQHITISIHDVLGRKIRTLENGIRRAGNNQISWDAIDDYGRQVAGGVYICSMKGGGAIRSMKMILLK